MAYMVIEEGHCMVSLTLTDELWNYKFSLSENHFFSHRVTSEESYIQSFLILPSY